MSASHPRSGRKGEKVDFKKLSASFEHSYGRESLALVAHLRDAYPEVTKPGRRTGNALPKICFFVWSSCRDGERDLIPTLVHAAVLLAAQDDYFDNRRIPTAEKESFRAAMNRGLRTNSVRVQSKGSPQLRDLTSLWSYVAGTIPQGVPEVRSYWVETVCQLNDAMAEENRAIRRATITYDEYMRSAVDSMGMVFIWTTYLANRHVPMTTLRELAPVLVRGAMVARLSNDIASYREDKKKRNAVTLVGGKNPRARILRRAAQESCVFHERVEALDLSPRVRGVLLHSIDFLREFYLRFNFDGGPAS